MSKSFSYISLRKPTNLPSLSNIESTKLHILIDMAWWQQRDRRVFSKSFLHDSIQEFKLRQIIFCNNPRASNFAYLFVQPLLHFAPNSKNLHKMPQRSTCIGNQLSMCPTWTTGFFTISYIAHSMATKVVSALSMIGSHVLIRSCFSVKCVAWVSKMSK